MPTQVFLDTYFEKERCN